jgi:uncharacterized membrane protein
VKDLTDATATPRHNNFEISWPHIACGAAGLVLSAYAWHVHQLILAGAATGCGITETISCDKVIGSKPWGAPFGVPLGVYGLAFFVLVLITAAGNGQDKRAAVLQRLAVGTLGLTTSLGLEFIMWVLLHHGCPVCMATHLVCLMNFIFAFLGWRRLKAPESAGKITTNTVPGSPP